MAQAASSLKYHQVEQALRDQINRGVYAGAALPGERALALQFDVARVTVRSALQRLLDDGVVVRLQAHGPLVPTGDFGTSPRRLLRDRVDKFLDRGRQDRRRVLGYARVGAPVAVARALNIAVGTQVLKVVRLRWDDQSTLTYTIAHVVLAHAVAMSRSALERKAMVELLMEAGVRIGAADQTIEAASAPANVARALKIAAGEPVLRLSRLVHDKDSRTVQLLEGWYRADRFSIRMLMSPTEDATTVWVQQRN